MTIQVSRDEFLKARREEKEAFEKYRARFSKKEQEAMHYVDAGDEVVCDSCNALITDDPITLNDEGNYALCEMCVKSAVP